ncbi:MAG TPA: DUF5691 domain-containing protein [Actinophytocola sp.]|uniref:DUF5691 domain-containing protein n=1 Tax=Actinophytocola sp. TaxID=1872138 RepID=UPI002DDD88C4|nr:DUF5691 domain-containing protein [Actinophytocola sp.]HEV2778837.1 DUF5691 domain-containing protein [Actinophytocola sp.]
MREWTELVSVALLGTARREVDTAALPEPVRRLVDDREPERALLSAAALLAAYRRAGRLPVREATALSPAPVDDRELVGPAARRRLALLLSGEQVALVPEWLAAVSARGLRVPPERLPALADAAVARAEWRAPVAAAAGPRGPWLAALRPDWEFLAEQAVVDDPEVWKYGTVTQRLHWLAATRSADRAAAMAALEEAWAVESAPVRVRLLEVLRAGLSTEDEEFLERALDDRARDVRRLAAELLAALPGSALSQRMAERLRPLVSVRRGALVVRLPAECDEGMRRDGVTAGPPAGVGARAWWLGQLVAAAPLSVWPARPGELVRLPVEGCDARLLHLGWAAAAVREGAADWVLALLDVDTKVATDHVLRALPRPWPVEIGNRVLDRLAGARDRRATAHLAEIAALAVPPECLGHPLVDRPLDPDGAAWRRRLADTLIFRREMYEELT